jgi:phosphocarrier protein HPr
MSGSPAINKADANTVSVDRELLVTNKLGIHARPAAMFVKTANRFVCDVFVEKDGETVNGKSIMGLMMLAAGPGCKIQVHAKGGDASQAVNELEDLLRRKFGED